MNQPDGLPSSKRRWVMLCILLGMVLSSLDSAIANVALPVIARSLASSNAAVVWVVSSYQLAVMVCLLPVAVLGESIGLKRLYALGLTVFTLASLSCALSPTLAVLVGARIVQGVGGACMSVAGMALVRTIYPRSIVGRGFALVALAVAVSGALGPTIAAGILAVARWPWLFLVNVPLGCLAVSVFLALGPPGVRQARRFDVHGAVLNGLAFGLIVVGVGTLGVGGVTIAVEEILAGLACLGLLIRQQRKQATPLLPLDLMRIPVFALSVGTSVCSYAAQILAYVSLPFFYETVLHLSPVETGLLLTPWPLLVAVAAPVSGRLMTRHPASLISSTGLAMLAAGLLLMAFLPAAPANWDIVWRMALCGIGFGLFQTPNNTALMTAGPVARSGAASGMVAVARYVGWSLGSALVALIFGVAGAHATVSCLVTGAGFAAVGALFSTARRYSQPAAPHGQPDDGAAQHVPPSQRGGT
ncbi:MFS transporter [Paraburkholderia sp. USG1]|uniref:MFS transporter n=1 Tax=Paraburkholderia sp. USG1 TaxID=2952268 RepID=UPI00285DC15A|nr:MFS transporter [Paraburkholderia sp. USG1]MDR8398319.1 MFS transporter [Paraburkholderia sp. USG1]